MLARAGNYPPSPAEVVEEVTPEIPLRNVENAVYNPLTKMWMIPQNDPFTLENFQQAYDGLVSGKSRRALTRAEAAKFAEQGLLNPTHFALRIYPRTEEEQWRVETMDDVSVVYAPFNYSGLTPEEATRVPQTRSELSSPFEESPYTVTYENYESTDGGTTGSVTYQLPILYAVWPVDKPLPANLEYKVDYEVFLPDEASDASLDAEALRTLVNEAVSTALNIDPALLNNVSTRAPMSFPLTVVAHDNTVGMNAPMANLKVKVQNGSYIYQTQTDYSGNCTVSISPNQPPWGVSGYFLYSLTYTYQDPQGKWKITTENSTAPHTVTVENIRFHFGAVSRGGAIILPETPQYTMPEGDRQANEIHRAANYFFNTQTDIPKPSLSGGIRIVANSTSNQTPTGYINGAFSYPRSGSSAPFMEIWNNGFPVASTIGTTLHELGHFAHYGYNNDRYRITILFLKESFSSYSGWYFSHEYYRSLGRTIYPDQDITAHGLYDGQGRQMWDKTSSDYYIPLLVDLTDDMSQRGYYGYFNPLDYPNDNLKNVTPGAVWSIIAFSQNWEQCRASLLNHAEIGRYNYSVAQFNEWITTFDEWLVNYPEYLTLLSR